MDLVGNGLCGDKSSTKDGGPCVFEHGHRFGGISYCMSQGDMEDGDKPLQDPLEDQMKRGEI